ncbi:MAG: isoaspartyl peptidase/L-asparaginase family protein [Candidatus Kariarchaeaceae archaeon]
MEYGVIVHGGAWNIPDKAVNDHLKGVKTACQAAFLILKEGGTAIDAAVKSIQLMEDDPTFDAGKGSFVSKRGDVEMDAIIATDDLKLGSVCAVQNVKNPIKLARLVMEKTKHVMLAGEGAYLFAKDEKLDLCSPEELLVGRELERYYEIKVLKTYESKESFRSDPDKDEKTNGMGTVGCVCQDKEGRIVIAVSTGGTPYKMAGRVGDSPLWGAGGYVESIGGAVATGFGEDLIRILATRQTVDYIRQGLSVQEAAEKTIDDLHTKVEGLGGIIALTKEGIGLAFNTPRMAYAYQTEGNEKPIVEINQVRKF